MPNTYPDTWNSTYEGIPADDENINLGANRIRDLKVNIRERVQYNHSFAGDGNDGKHTVVMTVTQTSDPTLDTGDGGLYAKAVSGVTELFYKNSAGQVSQLTSAGFLAVETGSMKVWPTTTAPAGWLLCNGQAVSRTTYAALYALVGVSFGSGDGSTTFNVPDLRGRTVAGYDAANASGRLTASAAGGVSASTIGNVGGEQAHALATGELASHLHSITDPTHSHSIPDPGHTHTISDPTHEHVVGSGGTAIGSGVNNVPLTSNTGAFSGYGPANGAFPNSTGITGTNNASTGITAANGNSTGITSTNAAGSGSSHNTVQPTMVLAIIIKT